MFVCIHRCKIGKLEGRRIDTGIASINKVSRQTNENGKQTTTLWYGRFMKINTTQSQNKCSVDYGQTNCLKTTKGPGLGILFACDKRLILSRLVAWYKGVNKCLSFNIDKMWLFKELWWWKQENNDPRSIKIWLIFVILYYNSLNVDWIWRGAEFPSLKFQFQYSPCYVIFSKQSGHYTS